MTSRSRTFGRRWATAAGSALLAAALFGDLPWPGAAGPPKKLPIVYVGPAGPGTQINVYFPNDVGTEPYGRCTSPPFSAVFSNFTLHTSGGQNIVKRLTNNPIYPGIKHAGGAVENPPDGWHLNRRSGVYTPFTECTANATRCPVSSGGTPNLLVLLTIGGELRSCNAAGFNSCDTELAPRFLLAPVSGDQVGPPVDHQLAYYGPTGFGSIGEQANVVINAGRSPATTACRWRFRAFRTRPPSNESPFASARPTDGPNSRKEHRMSILRIDSPPRPASSPSPSGRAEVSPPERFPVRDRDRRVVRRRHWRWIALSPLVFARHQ